MCLENIVNTIRDMLIDLDKDFKKCLSIEAAAQRARVKSIALGKTFKQYRKLSMDYTKEQRAKKLCK